jgi:hypothetical protein
MEALITALLRIHSKISEKTLFLWVAMERPYRTLKIMPEYELSNTGRFILSFDFDSHFVRVHEMSPIRTF